MGKRHVWISIAKFVKLNSVRRANIGAKWLADLHINTCKSFFSERERCRQAACGWGGGSGGEKGGHWPLHTATTTWPPSPCDVKSAPPARAASQAWTWTWQDLHVSLALCLYRYIYIYLYLFIYMYLYMYIWAYSCLWIDIFILLRHKHLHIMKKITFQILVITDAFELRFSNNNDCPNCPKLVGLPKMCWKRHFFEGGGGKAVGKMGASCY